MKQKFFRIFRIIADLRFSIFILLLISLISILGTVIEQDQRVEFYKTNYPITNPIFGIFTWNFILKFGFDHVYKTWWFFSLIFLFGFSLIFCTILQQLPSLKVARRCQFFRNIRQFYRLENFTILNNFSLNKILLKIKLNHYSIFQQRSIIYCYKGLIGRIAPILVHISIILILVGVVIGSLFGFKAQEMVSKTENFHIQNILANGKYSLISNTSARINDFWILYDKNQRVSQFYSDLSILNSKGKEVSRKTISVNSPLIYRNVYYYQTNWNLIGLRFKNKTKEIFQYPLTNFSKNSNKIWLTWITTNSSLKTGTIAFIDSLEGYCSIYNETGKFIGNIELQEFLNFNKSFSFLEILSATGLQIKTDPGIPIIYSGFFLLMISTLLSYRTYSQIWMIQENKKLFIGGTTNRATFEFELEFFNFLKESN